LASPPDPIPGDRLESWKEVAGYLRRDVTTVQRWERREGMPVHRHLHDKGGSVYAFRSELDAWTASRKATAVEPAVEHSSERVIGQSGEHAAPRRKLTISVIAATAALVAAGVWWFEWAGSSRESPLAGARFQQLTNFGTTEQAAALSRDGRFVAFLSNRDGRTDVWVHQIGTGQFYNLTRGAVPELVNPSVRTLGFSPDGTAVTFWSRKSSGSTQADIGVWAAPILGGSPRPYLEGVAEFDWSPDGALLVYHTPGPGDPTFVRDREEQARQILSAPAGLHAHFPVWAPDQSHIYFVQGAVPDRMDIWRIKATGGTPEQITHHDSRVSHPVFLDARTLVYLATNADGSGPSLYSLDVRRGRQQRLTFGLERYTSLAASLDGSRIVATMANPKSALWRMPVADARIDTAALRRISLTTGSGFAPRLGAEFLLYVTSKGENDSIWRLDRDQATELWSAPQTRVVGRPALSRDGARIAFVAERSRQRSLHIANADGTNARVLTSSLQLEGSPAWAPDGRSITVGAAAGEITRLLKVPLDGAAAAQVVNEYSTDPEWSSDGSLLVYSGPDIGTTFAVKIIATGASAPAAAAFTLSRGSRHVAFLPGRRALFVLRGEIAHKDLWLIDLDTGAERQLTAFPADFNVRDFDISPDGREIVVEQVLEQSDVVLIDRSSPSTAR
jgi:Tol biopolymer transport system component